MRLESEYDFPGFLDHLASAIDIFGLSKVEYPDFGRFWAGVKEVNGMFSDLELHRSDRAALRERLSNLCSVAKESQQEYRTEFNRQCDDHRDEISVAILGLRNSHDLDWLGTMIGGPDLKSFWADQAEVRELFKTLKPLRRDEREKLWDELNALCDKARYYQDQLNRARDGRREEWRSKMHDLIDSWSQQVDKKNVLIDRICGQIQDLESRKSDARTEEFADTVQGWIEDKETFISKLESQISELKDKITDVSERLDASEARR
ncbi:MAG: hypothetical protein JST30_11255 [Armatimonadetes bacterium]|nr:hypothetical protein [Armatimonadota bacterium]